MSALVSGWRSPRLQVRHSLRTRRRGVPVQFLSQATATRDAASTRADLATLVLSGLSSRFLCDVGNRPSEQVCARASNARVRACGHVLGGGVQCFPRSAKLLWSRGVWLEFTGFARRALGHRWWRVSRVGVWRWKRSAVLSTRSWSDGDVMWRPRHHMWSL